MRLALALVVLAAVLVGAGLAGVGGASLANGDGPHRTVADSGHLTPGPGNETTIVDRETLYETEIHAAPDVYDATLYFVAEDGTWYHAFPNGSIGSPAPDGDEIPLLSGETYDVPQDERPKYLWKVVADDGCSTTFFNAENTSDAAPLPIPGCNPPPTPTPPDETATAVSEPGTVTPTGTTPETTTAGQPGFGMALPIVSLVGAAWVALGRR